MIRINHPEGTNLWFMGAGQFLRESRQKHGITLNQMAKMVGAQPASLSRYENNKTSFTLEFLAQFCQTIGEDFPGILQKCLEEIIDNTRYSSTQNKTDHHQVGVG